MPGNAHVFPSAGTLVWGFEVIQLGIKDSGSLLLQLPLHQSSNASRDPLCFWWDQFVSSFSQCLPQPLLQVFPLCCIRGPVSMLLQHSQWYLTVPCYSVFSNLVGKVKGDFCSSDSVSASAGTMSLGLGMFPVQGSYPSPSCSSSYIMYSFPFPWSREFFYNLLQL